MLMLRVRPFHRLFQPRARGSVLIVALWMMTIFVMLVLSLGYRSNLEAKISLRAKEKRVNDVLLHSAVNLALYSIMSDSNPSVDSTHDQWYNSISFSEDVWPEANLSVSIVDSESKVNINTASAKQLRALFEAIHELDNRMHSDSEDLVTDILTWRGDATVQDRDVPHAEYKGGPFQSLYELLLLDEFDARDLPIMQRYCTIYGSEENSIMMNPNTASAPVLKAVIASLAGDSRAKDRLFEKIVAFRRTNEPRDNARVSDEATIDAATLPYFTQSDLSPYDLLNKLGISSDVLSVSLALQFIKFCTVDSKIFEIDIAARSADAAPVKRARAIIGPKRDTGSGIVREQGLQIFSWYEPVND
jgi:type II secretory pathway component PulK